MAIHVNLIDKIAEQTENMFNITNFKGKELLDKFSDVYERLNDDWDGTDAVANLTDLNTVYTAVSDLLSKLEKLTIGANDEAIGLQKDTVDNGGICAVGSTLASALKFNSLRAPKNTGVTDAREGILQDAADFNDMPTNFQNLVDALNEAKTELFANWTEGGNRAEIERLFKEFNDNVGHYKSLITKVRDNINTVAENKKKRM